MFSQNNLKTKNFLFFYKKKFLNHYRINFSVNKKWILVLDEIFCICFRTASKNKSAIEKWVIIPNHPLGECLQKKKVDVLKNYFSPPIIILRHFLIHWKTLNVKFFVKNRCMYSKNIYSVKRLKNGKTLRRVDLRQHVN